MKSIKNETGTNALPSGKTSPESSAVKTTPSDAFSELWRGKHANLSQQGENGRTLVVCLGPKGQSLGGSSMPNISEWPNDAAVCLLSQVLERDSIPKKYYLSPKACAGILRRTDKQGKTLPKALEDALAAATEKTPTIL
jgi:hypothetical protein